MRVRVLSLAALPVFVASAAALSPSDLRPAMTNAEQAFYDSIKVDTADAQGFLVTREYARKAQAVNSGELSPASFPTEKPDGFNVRYLLPNDPSAINTALGKRLYSPPNATASPRDDGSRQKFAAPAAISPSDLNPAITNKELKYYDSIKADPAAAQSFLITRDYVRKARSVNSGAMSPSLFPAEKPDGFNVRYLLPRETALINDAVEKRLTVLMKERMTR